MPDYRIHVRRFEKLILALLAEFGGFEMSSTPSPDDGSDITLVSRSQKQTYRFQLKARERITPQIAADLFERFSQKQLPPNVVRVVYAPVISDRVAEIAKQYNVSYVDYAGNCRIVDPGSGLLISRSGIPNTASVGKQKKVDLFSQKSSRISRVMLHEPKRGWKLSELAGHPDVDVSVGLVSKVKQTLIRENYAEVRNRLVYLKQPADLLKAWSREYNGAESQQQFYMRGETEEIEAKVSQWCEELKIDYALGRFSAAWRLAPEVRYSIASIYINPEAISLQSLEKLRMECGAKEVDSGANLVLLTPYDKSVFVRRLPMPEQTTSPLQTWLDLQSMSGRGAEAAEAVFEKYLRHEFEKVG